MKITKLDIPIVLHDDSHVKLTEMGYITEIMYSDKRSYGGYITKIDKDY